MLGCDSTTVLVIQKKVTPEIMSIARKARRRGCTIIYDVDDFGDALWYWVPRKDFEAILNLADLITTDTLGHRTQVMAFRRHLNVEVIPDAIDYSPPHPVMPPLADESPLRILWFGTVSNIGLFARYADSLASLPNVKVVVATGVSSIPGFTARYPGVEFVPWSRTEFISVLQSCHLTCLMHDGSDSDLAKSNNRMITSITWGVPALVSRTPEYARTAAECGVEDAVFGDERQLATVVGRFRGAERRNHYLGLAQPIIWNKYAPLSVADQFVHAIDAFQTPRNRKATEVLRAVGQRISSYLRGS
jgi:hypothetical protein